MITIHPHLHHVGYPALNILIDAHNDYYSWPHVHHIVIEMKDGWVTDQYDADIGCLISYVLFRHHDMRYHSINTKSDEPMDSDALRWGDDESITNKGTDNPHVHDKHSSGGSDDDDDDDDDGAANDDSNGNDGDGDGDGKRDRGGRDDDDEDDTVNDEDEDKLTFVFDDIGTSDNAERTHIGHGLCIVTTDHQIIRQRQAAETELIVKWW
jgi:hypothetical protein